MLTARERNYCDRGVLSLGVVLFANLCLPVVVMAEKTVEKSQAIRIARPNKKLIPKEVGSIPLPAGTEALASTVLQAYRDAPFKKLSLKVSVDKRSKLFMGGQSDMNLSPMAHVVTAARTALEADKPGSRWIQCKLDKTGFLTIVRRGETPESREAWSFSPDGKLAAYAAGRKKWPHLDWTEDYTTLSQYMPEGVHEESTWTATKDNVANDAMQWEKTTRTRSNLRNLESPQRLELQRTWNPRHPFLTILGPESPQSHGVMELSILADTNTGVPETTNYKARSLRKSAYHEAQFDRNHWDRAESTKEDIDLARLIAAQLGASDMPKVEQMLQAAHENAE